MNRNRFTEIDGAMRRTKVDIAINNIDVVDVFTNKILKNKNVAIVGKVIVGISDHEYDAHHIIHGDDKLLIPGLIDPHIHIESSYVNPENFMKLVSAHGTTSAFVDCHEIANTNGLEGIDYFLQFTSSPFNLKVWLPSCVPASKWEHAFKNLEASDLEKYYTHPHVIGLGEMMDFHGVVDGQENVIDKIDMCHKNGFLIDGHAPRVSGDMLNAYLSQNITADHEVRNKDEALNKITHGFHINLRYGDRRFDLAELIDIVDKDNINSFSICGDDINASTLLEDGHLDRAYKAVKDKVSKISKIDLIKMMTINTARANNMRYLGAIAPGYQADVVIINNLDDFKVLTTIANGEIIWDGKENHNLDFVVQPPSSTFRHDDFDENDFRVNYVSDTEYSLIEDGFANKGVTIKVKDDNGTAIPLEEGICKLSIIDRYKNTKAKNFTCFMKDFGLKSGAFAQSINHDSHNTAVVGTNDKDMAIAVNEIKNMGGGFVAVQDGKVLSSIKLEIGGVMTNRKADEFTEDWEDFLTAAKAILSDKTINPMLRMRGIGLTVVPEYKLSLFGLLDVKTNKILKDNFKMK